MLGLQQIFAIAIPADLLELTRNWLCSIQQHAKRPVGILIAGLNLATCHSLGPWLKKQPGWHVYCIHATSTDHPGSTSPDSIASRKIESWAHILEAATKVPSVSHIIFSEVDLVFTGDPFPFLSEMDGSLWQSPKDFLLASESDSQTCDAPSNRVASTGLVMARVSKTSLAVFQSALLEMKRPRQNSKGPNGVLEAALLKSSYAWLPCNTFVNGNWFFGKRDRIDIANMVTARASWTSHLEVQKECLEQSGLWFTGHWSDNPLCHGNKDTDGIKEHQVHRDKEKLVSKCLPNPPPKSSPTKEL